MSCHIKTNSKTNKLTVHTSCYGVLDLLCVLVVTKCLLFNRRSNNGLKACYSDAKFIIHDLFVHYSGGNTIQIADTKIFYIQMVPLFI